MIKFTDVIKKDGQTLVIPRMAHSVKDNEQDAVRCIMEWKRKLENLKVPWTFSSVMHIDHYMNSGIDEIGLDH